MITSACHPGWLLCGFWGLNSGPHTCAPRTLTTDPIYTLSPNMHMSNMLHSSFLWIQVQNREAQIHLLYSILWERGDQGIWHLLPWSAFVWMLTYSKFTWVVLQVIYNSLWLGNFGQIAQPLWEVFLICKLVLRLTVHTSWDCHEDEITKYWVSGRHQRGTKTSRLPHTVLELGLSILNLSWNHRIAKCLMLVCTKVYTKHSFFPERYFKWCCIMHAWGK